MAVLWGNYGLLLFMTGFSRQSFLLGYLWRTFQKLLFTVLFLTWAPCVLLNEHCSSVDNCDWCINTLYGMAKFLEREDVSSFPTCAATFQILLRSC